MEFPSNNQKGFTIIEMLVAVTAFAFVVMVATAAFSHVLGIERRATSLQKIQENAAYIMETIAKEIRVSEITNSNSVNCRLWPSTSLAIKHPVNGSITYFRDSADNSFHRNITGVADTVISSNEVEFTRFDFCISGAGSINNQPRISIIATVKSSKDPNLSINIQTTLSQRKIY